MKKITLLIPVLSIFIISCNNSFNEKSKEESTTVWGEKLQHIDDSEAIQLNNGEKWKVNVEMIQHIRNMEKDISDYSNSGQIDHKLLAEKLLVNVNLLTSSCTMNGKAHDELHKWLLPYIGLLKEFSEANNETEVEKLFQSIVNSMTTFNNYFQ